MDELKSPRYALFNFISIGIMMKIGSRLEKSAQLAPSENVSSKS
jgi:hypothetical protein